MKEVSVDRLSEIADEVFNLIDANDIFEFLDPSTQEDFSRLESRLQEIMQTRPQFETIELAMYLRASYSRSTSLPTWQPLLNSAVEQGIMRGESVQDIFFGLIPNAQHPFRNTGNL